MMKKIMVILLLSVFLLTSFAAARVTNGDAGPNSKRMVNTKISLFDAGDNSFDFDRGTGDVLYSPPPAYYPVGNWRQVYGTETTQHDRQHYTSSGRQIVYAGYWNSNCDYVYMNYSWRAVVGSSIILQCRNAIFDWSNGIWDYSAGGAFQAGPSGSFQNLPYTFAPNVDITLDNQSGVNSMSIRNDGAPWKSYVAYGVLGCPTASYMTAQGLPGPPNLEGITDGYCDENLGDETISPYLWPIIDVDSTDDGKVITHAVSQEWGFCSQVPSSDIDAASLVYDRKVATAADQPWTGTWDGPHFIDSVYNIAYIVRADKRPGNHTVYLAYMKPLYYQNNGAGGHHCAGNVFYQYTQDIVYLKSTNDGASWGSLNFVTDYMAGYEEGKTQPAAYELTGLVDPDGVFHLAWTSPSTNSVCEAPFQSKLYHWDNSNNCISLVYDGSKPANGPSRLLLPAWNLSVCKPNISYCDDKLYIVFNRFGAHTAEDDDNYYSDIAASNFPNADILLVGSDGVSGGMGQVWSDAVNITNTYTDSCVVGQCESEQWPTMAMYSHDSLMIEYILDLEAGAKADPNDPADATLAWTNNPIIFMTWPCFAMADLPQNVRLSVTPDGANYPEVPLAPNGNPSGCTTEATYEAEVVLANAGNVNLSYSASSNNAWLSITAGASGSVNAGTGPNNSDDPAWSGAPGCALPGVISWRANSTTLGAGNYVGTISVNIDNPAVPDFNITVHAVVACNYYLPEFATVQGGCWNIDLWNTPQAANQADRQSLGNMKFYQCGDTINPLYHEALMVGWKVGSVIHCYSDAITTDSPQLAMRALTGITVNTVGTPESGNGYYSTLGYWSTPDSSVQGKIEYFVPGHQDTSVLIEKVTLWNHKAVALNNFIVGEESDWDCDRDSSLDKGGVDNTRSMVYQQGDHRDQSVVAGLSCYAGQDGNFAAKAVNGYDYAYYTLGWYPDTMYNVMNGLSGLTVFSDSAHGTEMRVINRFIKGSLAVNDTIEICKVKAVSLDGVAGLQELIDKGMAYIENHSLCSPPPQCQGQCGDANADTKVNVSDAVYIINYVFVHGATPQPVMACGDANTDAKVNVSDAVYLINYVFVHGTPPGNCSAGAAAWSGNDCCAF